MSLPNFSDSLIDVLINELLYKKYNNLPLTNQGLAMIAEPSINSRPQIIPEDQIWTQQIPQIAPINLIDIDRKISYNYMGNDKYSIRQKSADFNYIEYYTKLKLYTTNNFSYRYFDGSSNNLLQNTIFSKTKNYFIKIYNNDIEIGAEIKWSIDCDSGYLNFYNSPFLSSDIITISFWKYTGIKGLLTNISNYNYVFYFQNDYIINNKFINNNIIFNRKIISKEENIFIENDYYKYIGNQNDKILCSIQFLYSWIDSDVPNIFFIIEMFINENCIFNTYVGSNDFVGIQGLFFIKIPLDLNTNDKIFIKIRKNNDYNLKFKKLSCIQFEFIL